MKNLLNNKLLTRKRLLHAVAGFVLVFSGIALMLSNLGIIRSVDFLWFVFFITLGGYLYYIAVKKIVIFEGLIASFLFPIGLIGLMSEFEMINFGVSQLWPITFIFSALYLIIHYANVRKTWLIYVSAVFILFGSILTLRNLHVIIFSLRDIIFKLWPMVLVFIGLYFLKGLVEKGDNRNF